MTDARKLISHQINPPQYPQKPPPLPPPSPTPSQDHLYLISAGGHDRSLFQWKFVHDEGTKEQQQGHDPAEPEPFPALPAPPPAAEAAEEPAPQGGIGAATTPPAGAAAAATPAGGRGSASARPQSAAAATAGGGSSLRSDTLVQQEERIRAQDAKLAEQGTLIEQLQKRLAALEGK